MKINEAAFEIHRESTASIRDVTQTLTVRDVYLDSWFNCFLSAPRLLQFLLVPTAGACMHATTSEPNCQGHLLPEGYKVETVQYPV
ncbi:hypothetical protein OK016_29545 [Vibrio chagasii]|nr:hypothetical protein [Vibrio chagasii]